MCSRPAASVNSAAAARHPSNLFAPKPSYLHDPGKISGCMGLRGGAERTRTSNQAVMSRHRRPGAAGTVAEAVARGGIKNRADKRRQRRGWQRQSRTKARNEHCVRSRPAELPLWITQAVVPAHLGKGPWIIERCSKVLVPREMGTGDRRRIAAIAKLPELCGNPLAIIPHSAVR
jgi:hypothetical protein